MEYVKLFFGIMGSLGLFLYGMKVMSDGIQQAAGERMQRVISLMTGNRISGVLTGCAVTAIIQSSSATTVMIVSFVNAGLLTLTQSIGVIMGANIGTTITAWIVSLIGFSLQISALAIPAIGLGFIMSVVKWKRKALGEVVLGFGLLFLGLDFLTKSTPNLSVEQLTAIRSVADLGFISILLGVAIGMGITLLIHSSSASTAITLTMAFQGLISPQFAAAMILGANIGTTVDAALASIGTKTAARRAALVHVLFNIIGTVWAVIFFRWLLLVVDWVTPGVVNWQGGAIPSPSQGALITAHLAMLHTVFNVINTVIFLPFVKQFAQLVSYIVKDADEKRETLGHYRLEAKSGALQDTPELSIIHAEKEIRDMASLASSMYARISGALKAFHPDAKDIDTGELVQDLTAELGDKERYADEMREEITRFLIECTRQQLSQGSETRVAALLRITASLEDMTDDCYGASLLLERSVKKDLLFKRKETEALTAYSSMVQEFLGIIERDWTTADGEQSQQAREWEDKINKTQEKLKKMGRKRIEAGENVKKELLFIDLVRRIEKVGDYCYSISEAIEALQTPRGGVK
ncbi:MAG: Na/Pi cotransporter family protein [Treponema sp.]|jgi:phosphate:Na+ symporter|nr:Na/Pi cotransporter family protein [Treponema sp.]